MRGLYTPSHRAEQEIATEDAVMHFGLWLFQEHCSPTFESTHLYGHTILPYDFSLRRD